MLSWFLKLFSRALNFLPRRVCCFLGDLFGAIWFLLFPIRRATVMENLSKAFPEMTSRARWRPVHFPVSFFTHAPGSLF